MISGTAKARLRRYREIFTTKLNSNSTPQTLRKIIAFLAFVCLIMDIVIAITRPNSENSLGHMFGIFLPDILTIVMFIKYVRNGLGRYPRKTRFTLFIFLLMAGLMWPVLSFVETGSAYSENGQYWDAWGLTRFDIFFCTAGFVEQVTSQVPTFVHLVRSRDFLCLVYLCLAMIELARSLRMFRTAAADVEKGDAKAGKGPTADDEGDIAMAPEDQKSDDDKGFKNEIEAEDVGK